MNTPNLYVRVRGRVLGPFNYTQLVALRKKGQLSRIHEVSEDGVAWSKASEFPALFSTTSTVSTPTTTQIQTPVSHSTPIQSGGTQIMQSPALNDDQLGDGWYYSEGNEKYGPVDLSQLVAHVQSGSLQPTSLVWGPTLAAWTPAKDVVELSTVTQAVTNTSRSGRAAQIFKLAAATLCIVGVAGGGAYFIFSSFSDQDSELSNGAIGMIDTRQTQDQLKEAVGLVVCGWRVTTMSGQRIERTFWINAIDSEADISFADPECRYQLTDDSTLRKDPTGNYEVLRGGTGTCFIVTPDGHALTNKHVVEEIFRLIQAEGKVEHLLSEENRTKDEKISSLVPTVWVFFGGEGFIASIDHVSDQFDLAILKVDREDSAYFRLAANNDLIRGDAVWTAGFPGSARGALPGYETNTPAGPHQSIKSNFTDDNFEFVQNDGSVSQISRRHNQVNVIMHSAKINPGNSGGPLFTKRGLVTGINTWANDAGDVNFSQAMPQLRSEVDRHVPDATWD